MKMSVSTRTLATVPLVTVRSVCVWVCAEGGRERRVDVDLFVGQVGVEGPPDDLRECDAFCPRDLVDATALVGGQVHLCACGWHTACCGGWRRHLRMPCIRRAVAVDGTRASFKARTCGRSGARMSWSIGAVARVEPRSYRW
jgi:hypothetical protein